MTIYSFSRFDIIDRKNPSAFQIFGAKLAEWERQGKIGEKFW